VTADGGGHHIGQAGPQGTALMNGRELPVGAVDELHDFDATSPIEGGKDRPAASGSAL
jgi:hypothetical protein